MAELIGCRSCDSPNCKGCNIYTLDEALRKNHFNLLMDEHHSIHINADVRPVVRGKWIPVTNGRGGSECNMCHAYAPSYQSGREYNSPYCPNCGADMRGDTDGVELR